MVIGADDFIQRCAAVKIMQNLIHNGVQMIRNDTDPAFDVNAKDEMIHDHAAKVCTKQAEYHGFGIIAQN